MVLFITTMFAKQPLATLGLVNIYLENLGDYYFHTSHKSLMGMLPSCSTSHAIFKTVLVFRFRPFLAVRVHFDPP